MHWLVRDLKEVLNQFKTPEFWISLLLIAFFSWLTYLLIHFSFLTDNILLDTRNNSARCRPLNNGSIIFLFSSMVFFAFSAILMLGELQRYMDLKGQKALRQASRSLLLGIVWGIISTAIATGVLIFFDSLCL